MYLDTYSISPGNMKGQVVPISRFQRSRAEKDCGMSELSRFRMAANGLIKSVLNEEKARLIMHFIAEREGVTFSEIRDVILKRYGVALSYGVARRIVGDLEKELWCIHTEQAQKKTGIKPIYIISVAPTLDRGDITRALNEEIKALQRTEIDLGTSEPPVQLDLEAERSDSSYALLAEGFEHIRPAAQEKHFELIAFIGQGVRTVNRLASYARDHKQSVHTRLGRLSGFRILGREKCDEGEGLEFHYFLASGITIGDLKKFALEKGFLFPHINLQTQVQSESHQDEVLMPSQKDLSDSGFQSSSNSSAYEKLLEYLPKFDPEWSDEIKADWFKAYRQITELAKEDA